MDIQNLFIIKKLNLPKMKQLYNVISYQLFLTIFFLSFFVIFNPKNVQTGTTLATQNIDEYFSAFSYKKEKKENFEKFDEKKRMELPILFKKRV